MTHLPRNLVSVRQIPSVNSRIYDFLQYNIYCHSRFVYAINEQQN